MRVNEPIEYSGKVLDKRNTLSGPDDRTFPKRPQHVKIPQPGNNNDK